MAVRRVLRAMGWVLVWAGLLVLVFVAYELWGTGLVTAGHQRALRQQFDRELRATGGGHPGPATTSAAGAGSGRVPAGGGTGGGNRPVTGRGNRTAAAGTVSGTVADGQPVGVITIPAIGANYVVVQGTDATDLALGPGHYPGTPMPGQPGNVGIAGHRTTYLHPFFDLNELVPGDPVYVTTPRGRFRYDVTRAVVVAPTDVSVLDPTPTPTLTLTTCNPRYSAATRLVVQASLVSPAAPAAPAAPGAGAAAGGRAGGGRAPTLAPAELAGTGGRWAGAVWWGLACAAVAGALWLARRRRARWWAYLVGGCGLAVLLWCWFGALTPVLPPGF